MRVARLACSAMLAAVLSPLVSVAQEKEGADERRALLDKAQSARTASRHDEAIELARKAAEIKASSSLRRFIAEELAALERYAEAYNEAKRCTEDAGTDAPSPNHDVVFLGCRSLVHDLTGKVALLSFDWGGPPPEGLAVIVNGEPLDQAPEHAVTPGAVTIEASAPDKNKIAKKLELHKGEVKVVEVRFEAVAARSTSVASSAKGVPEPPPKAAPLRGRLWGPIVGGVGMASAATGVVLLVVAQVRYDNLARTCDVPTHPCPIDDPRAGPIKTMTTWGNVTLISGIGLAAAGAVWFVLDRRPSPNAGATDWRVGVSPGAIELYKSF